MHQADSFCRTSAGTCGTCVIRMVLTHATCLQSGNPRASINSNTRHGHREGFAALLALPWVSQSIVSSRSHEGAAHAASRHQIASYCGRYEHGNTQIADGDAPPAIRCLRRDTVNTHRQFCCIVRRDDLVPLDHR